MDDDEDEGDEEVEEEPDVDHLQVGGVGQAVVDLQLVFHNFFTQVRQAIYTALVIMSDM